MKDGMEFEWPLARLSAVIRKEGEGVYVSFCPQLELASQGRDSKEAWLNLRAAVSLYLSESRDVSLESWERKPEVEHRWRHHEHRWQHHEHKV